LAIEEASKTTTDKKDIPYSRNFGTRELRVRLVDREKERELELLVKKFRNETGKLELQLEKSQTTVSRYKYDFFKLQQESASLRKDKDVLRKQNDELKAEVAILRKDNDVTNSESHFLHIIPLNDLLLNAGVWGGTEQVQKWTCKQRRRRSSCRN